jgi:hypothetical protein
MVQAALAVVHVNVGTQPASVGSRFNNVTAAGSSFANEGANNISIRLGDGLGGF